MSSRELRGEKRIKYMIERGDRALKTKPYNCWKFSPILYLDITFCAVGVFLVWHIHTYIHKKEVSSSQVEEETGCVQKL